MKNLTVKVITDRFKKMMTGSYRYPTKAIISHDSWEKDITVEVVFDSSGDPIKWLVDGEIIAINFSSLGYPEPSEIFEAVEVGDTTPAKLAIWALREEAHKRFKEAEQRVQQR